MRNTIKWIAIGYSLAIALIFVMADNEAIYALFSFLTDFPYGDKLTHFFLMGIWSFIINLAFSCQKIRLWRVGCLLGSMLVWEIVTLEEFSQIMFSHRTFDLVDLAFDYAGIGIFSLLACWLYKAYGHAVEPLPE